MKGCLLRSATALSALMLATLSAHAADVSASSPPYYNPYPTQPSGYIVPAGGWNGFYVGALGSGAWATSNHTDVSGLSSGDFNQDGYAIGVTAGYNWQLANVLFGFEGDASWADITGSTGNNCSNSCFTTIRWFDTARARLGYAAGNVLPYVTGGAAFVNLNAGQPGVGGSNDRVGGTIGGGIEWLFASSLSLKAEYLYAAFASQTTYTSAAGLPVSVTERDVSLARVGLNYHFNY
jgi:outer membrane immunogenic protein